MAEHNFWKTHKKATYLTAALNELAAHNLHGVSTGAAYVEVIWRLRIATFTTTWKQRSTFN
jgi:hypothetical protein